VQATENENPLQKAIHGVGNFVHGQMTPEPNKVQQANAAMSDPFLPEKALLAPLAAPAGAILHQLQKTGDTSQAILSGHPEKIVPSLTRGLTEQERNADRDSLLGGAVKAGIDKLPAGWPQTVGRGIVDTALDPLTYAGGLGPLAKGYKALSEHALPAVLNAAEKTTQAGEGVARKFGGAQAAHDLRKKADNAGFIAAGAYKASVPGGDLKLNLAKDFGSKAQTISNRMFSAKNAGKAQAQALSNALVGELHDAVHGLTPEQESAIYQALHLGKTRELPEEFKGVAARLKGVTDSLAHLSGDRELRGHLSQQGFTLPDYAKPFDRGIRSLQKKSQYRRSYVPTAGDGMQFTPEEFGTLDVNKDFGDVESALQIRRAEGPRNGKTDVTDETDKNLEKRQDHGSLLDDPLEQRAVFENRLRSGARAIAGRDTSRRAAHLFNTAKPSYNVDLGPGNMQKMEANASSFAKLPHYVKKFFTDEFTPEASKGAMQKAGDALKHATDAPKSAMFISPVRHMMNIAQLGSLADPSIGGALQTANTFRKIVRATPQQRYAELKDAIDAGAVGVPSHDRVTGETAAQGIAAALQRTPVISHAVNGVRKLYTMSGDILWSFDDASKATRFRRLVAQGEHPADAAAQTSAELIDYSNKSDFTKMLQYFAPFATYRSKLPGAIARNVAQHPERALTVNRMSPTLAGGSQDAGTGPDGKPIVSKSNLPLAEGLRMADGPHFLGILPEDYARSTASYPVKGVASSLGIGDNDNYTNYMTYGKQMNAPGNVARYLGNAITGSIPVVSQGLDAIGLGMFPDRGFAGVLSAQTGLGTARKPVDESLISQYMQLHPRATRRQAINHIEFRGGVE
jgi:hypothetical protein